MPPKDRAMSVLVGRAHRGAARVCVCVNRLGPVCVEFGTVARFVRRTVAAWLWKVENTSWDGLYCFVSMTALCSHYICSFFFLFPVVVLECDFFYSTFQCTVIPGFVCVKSSSALLMENMCYLFMSVYSVNTPPPPFFFSQLEHIVIFIITLFS